MPVRHSPHPRVTPGWFGLDGLPRGTIRHQEMPKATAFPELEFKPLSWGSSRGVGLVLGDAGKLKEKAIMGRVPQSGTLHLRGRRWRWVPGRRQSPVVPRAGQDPRGQSEPCPHQLFEEQSQHRVFWAWSWFSFYPFVGGFPVAASYLFLCFGLVVFQSFLRFFLLRFLSAIMNHEGLGYLEQALSIPWAGELNLFCPQGFQPLVFTVVAAEAVPPRREQPARILRLPHPALSPETRGCRLQRTPVSTILGWGFCWVFLGEEKQKPQNHEQRVP